MIKRNSGPERSGSRSASGVKLRPGLLAAINAWAFCRAEHGPIGDVVFAPPPWVERSNQRKEDARPSEVTAAPATWMAFVPSKDEAPQTSGARNAPSMTGTWASTHHPPRAANSFSPAPMFDVIVRRARSAARARRVVGVNTIREARSRVDRLCFVRPGERSLEIGDVRVPARGKLASKFHGAVIRDLA